MGQASHEDNAGILAEALNRDRHAGGRAASDHDRAVFLDHALGAGAGRVRLCLGVAGDEGDLLAVDAALQHLG